MNHVPLTLQEKAALYDAIADMARFRGQVILYDRLDQGVQCIVGGSDRTQGDGDTLPAAVEAAAWKMGLDAKPRASSLPLTRDTQPCTVLPDTEEGGP